MWTGRQTLQSLESGLRSVKSDLDLIEQELNQITDKQDNNRQQQAKILQRLAEIRFDEIKRGGLREALDFADREALEINRKRTAEKNVLEKRLLNIDQKISEQEREREDFVHRVEEAAQRVIDAEHRVQKKLEEDLVYQEQLEKARLVDLIGHEASKKYKRALQDKAEKGKPFENDALFIYLWKRRYGTSEYKANPLFKTLDNWVAGLCNYDKARVNYWTLLEIPQRLQEHLNNVQLQAEKEKQRLVELETLATEDSGIPLLQKSLETAEDALETYDATISRAEESRNSILEKRAVFASGQDSYTESSVKLLNDLLERSDVFDLSLAVKMTPSREDDALARDLLELREENKDLQKDLKDSRKRQDKQLKRLQEIEEVRRKFKQHRFDDLRSGFTNETLITSVLSQFLSGMINGADLWSTMRRHQRHRDVGAWPDFGSGGLGRSKRKGGGGVWFQPGRRGGGSFRMPRNGGFSSRGRGGGFSTGGGF